LIWKEIPGVSKSLAVSFGNRWPHAYAKFSVRSYDGEGSEL